METPIYFTGGQITPKEYFYRRNHFSYPDITDSSCQLHIDGLVEYPRTFTFSEILSLNIREVITVLECAGNRRHNYNPKVYGEDWGDGALSLGVWKGVSLSELLALVGVQRTVREIVFTGRDNGEPVNVSGHYYYQRSLPVKTALAPDTIIAFAYNGRPIPVRHGYPLRLIVPSWYAMASVKWLNRVTAISDSFEGPFQTLDYNYYPDLKTDIGKYPVTRIRVNSLIQYPLDRSIIKTGIHQIEGIAWTGKGTISRVELSFDIGQTWMAATLRRPISRYSWTEWSFDWEAFKPGNYTILVRAYDSSGRVQPVEAKWNRSGYGYNAVSKATVRILI
jgi:DMSO/TMAO reductase YedYZ molybdopterin-dependent catalytic subunit